MRHTLSDPVFPHFIVCVIYFPSFQLLPVYTFEFKHLILASICFANCLHFTEVFLTLASNVASSMVRVRYADFHLASVWRYYIEMLCLFVPLFLLYIFLCVQFSLSFLATYLSYSLAISLKIAVVLIQSKTEEMAQWLSTLPALPEVLTSVPSKHTMGSDSLFWCA